MQPNSLYSLSIKKACVLNSFYNSLCLKKACVLNFTHLPREIIHEISNNTSHFQKFALSPKLKYMFV